MLGTRKGLGAVDPTVRHSLTSGSLCFRSEGVGTPGWCLGGRLQPQNSLVPPQHLVSDALSATPPPTISAGSLGQNTPDLCPAPSYCFPWTSLKSFPFKLFFFFFFDVDHF